MKEKHIIWSSECDFEDWKADLEADLQVSCALWHYVIWLRYFCN